MQARMRRPYLFTVVAATSLVVLGGTTLAQSANAHVGTWRLNLAKSKYSPGPALKSGITKIESAGGGVKYTVDQVGADGTARHWEYTANYDGKDTPVIGNNPDADTVALTQVNPTTVRIVNKKDGRVTTTVTSVVSGFGRMRTVTTTGRNAIGQTVNNVVLYEKQ